MARRTIMVCDNCQKEVEEQKSAVLRINFADARKASRQADLCDDCASNKMPGQAVPRRGRKPREAVSA